MTEQERMDEIIRSAASDYNRPPATPTDDMWNAIVAAKQGDAPRLQLATGGAPRSAAREGHSLSRRFSTPFAWIGMAAAALLLIATGVGIGRWTNHSAPAVRRTVEAPPNMPVAPPDEVSPAPAPETDFATPERTPERVERQPGSRERSREEILRNPRVVGTGTVNRLARLQSDADGRLPSVTPVSNTYQVATQRHLADAEALLTSFTLGTRDARMDAQFAVWAKGLLSNTRLLLDSPAGDDPRRAKLLQDLELVLAQIVQLSPNALAQDRELIQGSIQSGHVMTRLRTAIPADGLKEIPER